MSGGNDMSVGGGPPVDGPQRLSNFEGISKAARTLAKGFVNFVTAKGLRNAISDFRQNRADKAATMHRRTGAAETHMSKQGGGMTLGDVRTKIATASSRDMLSAATDFHHGDKALGDFDRAFRKLDPDLLSSLATKILDEGGSGPYTEYAEEILPYEVDNPAEFLQGMAAAIRDPTQQEVTSTASRKEALAARAELGSKSISYGDLSPDSAAGKAILSWCETPFQKDGGHAMEEVRAFRLVYAATNATSADSRLEALNNLFNACIPGNTSGNTGLGLGLGGTGDVANIERTHIKGLKNLQAALAKRNEGFSSIKEFEDFVANNHGLTRHELPNPENFLNEIKGHLGKLLVENVVPKYG